MRTDIGRSLLMASLLPAVVFAFQNCSPGFHVAADPDAEIFKLASDCMKSQAEACGFSKNAVAQAGKAMTPERIGGFQTQPLSLNGRDATGYLQNADFIVTTAVTPRLHESATFRHYYQTGVSNLEQVMAYASLDRVRQWMLRAGVFPGAGRSVRVIADSSFNGWVPGVGEVHLQRDEKNFPAAIDGSLVAQLYAQANVSLASNGASDTVSGSKTIACPNSSSVNAPRGCCSSALGCGPALVSGAADYVAAAVFGGPLGEGWKNDPAGLSICGLRRDPAAHSTLDSSQVLSTCGTRGYQVNAMGLVYASAWWQARAKAADTAAFDAFFMRHLAHLAYDDDFATVQAKITATAATASENAFAADVTAALSARGR